jgi:hypothetical protein
MPEGSVRKGFSFAQRASPKSVGQGETRIRSDSLMKPSSLVS